MSNLNNAKWIWQNSSREEKDQYIYFRKTIESKVRIEKIEINISASDKYKLYINGEFIGVGPSPCSPEFQYYDSYIIDKFNCMDICISVVAYSIGEKTYMVTQQNQGIGGFICNINVHYIDGSVKEINSDESFRAIVSSAYFKDYIKLGESRISNWGGYKETYISYREFIDWQLPNYNDEDWQASVVLLEADKTFVNLIPREIPMLHYEKKYPVLIEQLELYRGRIEDASNLLTVADTYATIDASIAGSFPSIVIDFGIEVVGYLEFVVSGSLGASMNIWYGESLEMMLTDTLIMNGKKQVYRPYHRRAFRFIKLTFSNSLDIIKLYNVNLDYVHYPYNMIGKFNCSNELLNKIWDTSVYTVLLGSQDHFEDSIMREGMQWLADARVMSLINYWVFGDKKLPAKAIKQFFRIQYPDGKIPASGPQRMDGPTVDFCQHFIMMIYEYYFYTGDVELIKEYYPQMQRLMDKFESIVCEDGLISLNNDKSWGVFLDWANLDKRDKVTALNCFYYKILNIYSEILLLIGIAGSEKYSEQARKLKETINSKMFDEDKGLFFDCIVDGEPSKRYSQQTNLIAIYCDIVEEKNISDVIEIAYKSEDIERIKGAFLLSFAVDTLFLNGKKKLALEFLEDFWGEMLNRGATTWWETFDRNTPSSCIPTLFSTNSATPYFQYIPVSHCHGWGSGPAYILMKNVAGIIPLTPNFKKIKFEPFTEGLDFAEAVIPTIYGNIQVKWEKIDGKLQYKIDKPDEVEIEAVNIL